MKRTTTYIFLLSIFILLSSCTTTQVSSANSYWDNCTFTQASNRSQKFVDAINDQNPLIIYSLFTENYKNKISKEEFVRRYNDDLTYPYISPLYCYIKSINIHYYDDNGLVSCSVASRLIGDSFTFEIIYENGDYYFKAFEDIIDNSYKEKFANKVVKWI
ncbi:MAG: hypothetical protein ACPKNR_01375 [Pleomorphochaeta sp.]